MIDVDLSTLTTSIYTNLVFGGLHVRLPGLSCFRKRVGNLSLVVHGYINGEVQEQLW
jgi:hypothetical protein